MNILILTQYYLPETGAPQNRLSSLALHLQNIGNNVLVHTAMPNYPRGEIYPGYENKKSLLENINGITVSRSSIFITNKKNLSARLRNYFSFAASSYYHLRQSKKKIDVLVCESPPLFLGITAVYLKRKFNCKLVFNVSDLWPESVEKMGIIKNKWIIKRAYKLANWIYKNADLISGQTKGIVEGIRQMQPSKKIIWFPNGVDLEFFSLENTVNSSSKNSFDILYAGIIGHAQGLEIILHAANNLQHTKNIHFYIIGDGPEKTQLLRLQTEYKLSNVTFISNQPREFIFQKITECNAYLVPLRKLDLFKGAIPSKLFEPLAFGKPILLGVDGEAKQLFIDEGKGGLYFEPENVAQLTEAIMELYNNEELAKTLGSNGKKYVMQYFNREEIAKNFDAQLKQLF